jgi:hypothetical protein
MDKGRMMAEDGKLEMIAYKLFEHILAAERELAKELGGSEGRTAIDREWILNTFAECLYTVRGTKKSQLAETMTDEELEARIRAFDKPSATDP